MAHFLKSQHIKLQIMVAVVVLFSLPITAQAMLAIAFLIPFALALTLIAGAVFGRFALICTAILSLVTIFGTAVKSLRF